MSLGGSPACRMPATGQVQIKRKIRTDIRRRKRRWNLVPIARGYKLGAVWSL